MVELHVNYSLQSKPNSCCPPITLLFKPFFLLENKINLVNCNHFHVKLKKMRNVQNHMNKHHIFFKSAVFWCVSNRTHWTLQWPNLLVKQVMVWCVSQFTNSLHKQLNYNLCSTEVIVKDCQSDRPEQNGVWLINSESGCYIKTTEMLSPHRWVEPCSCYMASLEIRSGPQKTRHTTLAQYDCSFRVVSPGRRHSSWPSAGHHGPL